LLSNNLVKKKTAGWILEIIRPAATYKLRQIYTTLICLIQKQISATTHRIHAINLQILSTNRRGCINHNSARLSRTFG